MLRYLALVISFGILGVAGISAPSLAQEPRVLCPEGQELDPYEIWSVVESDDEAKAFLRAEYKRFENHMEFATWLSCQGFNVSILDGPFGSVLKQGERRIWAGYGIAYVGREALWGATWLDQILKKHAHTFQIYVDQDGNISWITVGLTFK